ncbi:hypothetical protein RYX36_014694, partial [Vicia faba]
QVVAEFEDIIPVIKTSIAGSRHVGRYCIGNKHGLLLPHTITPEEYQHIRRSLPHATVVQRIPEGLTCYARFIACNDHVALAHTELHQGGDLPFSLMELKEGVVNVNGKNYEKTTHKLLLVRGGDELIFGSAIYTFYLQTARSVSASAILTDQDLAQKEREMLDGNLENKIVDPNDIYIYHFKISLSF